MLGVAEKQTPWQVILDYSITSTYFKKSEVATEVKSVLPFEKCPVVAELKMKTEKLPILPDRSGVYLQCTCSAMQCTLQEHCSLCSVPAV